MTMTDHRHGHPEDEYFVREDAEKKRKLALQVKKETEAAELARLKALHHMRCPKCGLLMQEVKFRRIDVDVCFACNGIFLDRGELEHSVTNVSPGVVEAVLNWFKGETTP
jgi:Zn-finger nucleic acid-binding protein